MEVSQKQMLKIEEQLDHLKNKGIKFESTSVEEAKEYLQKNNNFYKLMAYRKNFAKHPDGEDKGKYIDLNFFQLKDLSIIDMRLRYLFLHLALDIEHYAKMKLISRVENSNNDGYTIVSHFIDGLDEKQKEIFQKEIQRNKSNTYCGSIVEKYDGKYPIWVFVEIIPFGQLVSFYKFCAEFFDDKYMRDDYYRLLTCKEIRNASAHSNCIINDLKPDTANHRTNDAVSREIMKIGKISKSMRTRKMSNARMQQIITLLYTHVTFVTSKGIHKHESIELNKLVERMFLNIEIYNNNETIKTSLEFMKIVVDNWFGLEYNDIT